ncbi:MAG: 2-C-methyl-D-erythritol 4-phosphate cytidylyltransferase [Methylophilaceae bacterium 17-44-8]|jgi:2-C-methyl-D-erythritol 4-phosphate cytidylyltransferase|nr:MAG: 2-C-methyl-D-erythritol 4-phosphate cytidylyltransferase [Methylophilales bacterium 28-44-11]OZA06627.1 MAG: 2-C-methyl-D-erythritol 4-phosphate cytidylyltransferase [Methylophilaceae bacterium 17-44-8]
MTKLHALIPAAGNGARMGAEIPKQYLMLHGKPLIQHVIHTFEQSESIHSVHVVLSPEDETWAEAGIHLSAKTIVHTCGGATRAETVLNGLNAMACYDDTDWVLVHDAARPGLDQTMLNLLIESLREDEVGGLLAMPLADTLKLADATQHAQKTIPREQLWQAQTPQMFKIATLRNALSNFHGVPTDEAQAIESLGLQPTLVRGALRNLKVTYPEDLAVLNALITE